MDLVIIKRFEEQKAALREAFTANLPQSYEQLVTVLVRHLSCDDLPLDPERIVKIDHGEYQGTLIFVIGALGYQPSDYWGTTCRYGSCSGCDTMLDIIKDGDSQESKVDDMMTLALHLVQQLRQIL